MTAPLTEMHSLIIYIIFGYTLLLPLLLVSLRLFDITGPLQRSSLYLVAFLTPPAAFILYHTVLVKRCQAGLTPLWTDHALHLLCIVSEGMLHVFIPLLGLFLFFGLLKAGAAVIMIKRLEREEVKITTALNKLITTIVGEQSGTLGIAPPRFIISSREGFAAFTTGFLRPILVINRAMIDLLDKSELQALISHELIHIRQRDTLKNWLLHYVRDLTFLNPFSSIIFRGYLLEKEILCDQKAARLAGQSPRQYAALLLKVWRSIIDHRTPRLGALSSFTGKNNIERRVEALMKGEQKQNRFTTLLTTLLGILIFTTTLLFLGLVC